MSAYEFIDHTYDVIVVGAGGAGRLISEPPRGPRAYRREIVTSAMLVRAATELWLK